MPSTSSTVLSSPHPRRKESTFPAFKEKGMKPFQSHTGNLNLKIDLTTDFSPLYQAAYSFQFCPSTPIFVQLSSLYSLGAQ